MDSVSPNSIDDRSLTNKISPKLNPNSKRDQLDFETTGGSARKSGGPRDSGHSILNSILKSTSQFKKPQYRRNVSPLNWFPRKKTDSYLMRKIRHLQEIGGMNLSLDETLGDACPHYTRMAREKIAAREAARKAMEARKAAMVEASWCRILQAARIQSKEAELEREKAEKCATEAFEAAKSMGVMMYDRPECPRRPCEIETSSAIGGKSTHTVTASFETAFEVDKEVAAAVRKAFIQLASCPSSSNKEEFKDLLRKISQNPDAEDSSEYIKAEISSVSEADLGSGSKYELQLNHDVDKREQIVMDQRTQNNNLLLTDSNRNSSVSPTDLADMMLDRIKKLQDDELNSLATIVATYGLNAALVEVENYKDHEKYSITRITDVPVRKKEADTEIPSLDQVLVKRLSRLEKEVQEARNSKKSNLEEVKQQASVKSGEEGNPGMPSLDKFLVKHVSKLEKEIKEARDMNKNNSVIENQKYSSLKISGKETNIEMPSLDQCLGKKHVSKFEKEIKEARNSRKSISVLHNQTSSGAQSMQDSGRRRSYSRAMPSKSISDLGSVLVKRISRLEREVLEAKKNNNRNHHSMENANSRELKAENVQDGDAMKGSREGFPEVAQDKNSELTKSKEQQLEIHEDARSSSNCERLNKENLNLNIVAETAPQGERHPVSKHMSQSEKEKVDALPNETFRPIILLGKEKKQSFNQDFSYVKHSNARKEAREREMLAAWGGLSLDSAVKPHLSRLEKEKAAWRKAEEEERKEE